MKDTNEQNEKSGLSRRHLIVGAATLAAGAMTAALPGLANAAPQKTEEIDNVTLAKRIEHLEKQNEYIISLLEKITSSALNPKGMSLPKEKPDFATIKQTLRTVLAQPQYSSIVSLGEFQSKNWLAQAVLIYKVKNMENHWQQLEQIVREVSTKCNVPGRVSGWQFAPNDSSHIIGSTIEFGYSYELGYDHENEFINLAKSKH